MNDDHNARNRILELQREIRRHNDLYYNRDTPEISDAAYDALMWELRQLEDKHPDLLTADSPTQQVGGTQIVGIPVPHPIPLLSLKDVFESKEVQQFVLTTQDKHPETVFSVEEKIDGLSLALEYRDGMLARASTRGDGHVGEDVTANVLALRSVPKQIATDIPYLKVRGECYMEKADFERINEEQLRDGEEPYANARNCAAGTLRQTQPSVAQSRNLKVFVFELLQAGVIPPKPTHFDWLEWLNEIGLPVIKSTRCSSYEEVWTAINNIQERRSSLPYGIDGAVVKVAPIETQQELGSRNKSPRWAIAYKYPAEEATTTVEDICTQVGRTGRITPVAILNPVNLAGSTITRSTLHNFEQIRKLDLRIGDTIRLEKGGDIIPKITGVEFQKRPDNTMVYQTPSTCPVCHGPTGSIEGSVDLYCLNDECPAKSLRALTFFCSKSCMDITGAGPSTLKALLEAGYVKTPADLYSLHKRRDELVRQGIIGKEKTVDNLLRNVEKSKQRDAVRVMKSLGGKEIGSHVSRILLSKYGSIPAIMSLTAGTRAQLVNLDGIGHGTVDALFDMTSSPEIQELVNRLTEAGVNMTGTTSQQKLVTGTQPLSGLTFVLTGTLPGMSRDEAKQLIEANGGKVSSSISGKTSYLLAGEAAGTKLTKAVSLNIPVIDMATFLDMIS